MTQKDFIQFFCDQTPDVREALMKRLKIVDAFLSISDVAQTSVLEHLMRKKTKP